MLKRMSQTQMINSPLSGVKNPIACGALGTIIGFAKESLANADIVEISIIKINGHNYLPDTWYDIDGHKVEMEDLI